MNTLPAHIMNALAGNLIAVNTITAPIKPRTAQALNSAPISINLSSSINAIDDIDYQLEAHTLDGDNSHVSIE